VNARCRVLIGDDHKLMVEGLQRILEREYEVVGTSLNGHELVRAATELKPDVVLVDITMPMLNGIDATRHIKAANEHTCVIVVTMHTEPEFVAEAFEAGASGYVLKRAAGDELLTAIRKALAGERYVTSFPGASIAFSGPKRRARTQLTARQREILQLVAEGKSAKEIAYLLDISVKTVAFHKTSIFEALGLRTTAELTRYAIDAGII
jgi:DNA-binding NarL/FixJ family response regulator